MVFSEPYKTEQPEQPLRWASVATGRVQLQGGWFVVTGGFLGVVGGNPFLVFAGADLGAPGGVVQIPLDGLGEAGFPGFGGAPLEVALDFGAVYGVAAVVGGGGFCAVSFNQLPGPRTKG